MVVGVAEIEVRIPEVGSLKGKRSVVRKLIERTRSRFSVAIAEVEKQDVHSRAVIGLAVVGNDRRVVNGVLDRVIDFVEGLAIAELVAERVEILNL